MDDTKASAALALEVTPAMEEAGAATLAEADLRFDDYRNTARAVFEAMVAASIVEAASPGDRSEVPVEGFR